MGDDRFRLPSQQLLSYQLVMREVRRDRISPQGLSGLLHDHLCTITISLLGAQPPLASTAYRRRHPVSLRT